MEMQMELQMELQRFIPPAYLLEYFVTEGPTAPGEPTSVTGELTSTTGGPAATGEPYKYLSEFSVFNILLFVIGTVREGNDFVDGIRTAVYFLAGEILSVSAGWADMIVATDANIRITQASMVDSLPTALRVSFSGGSVMGFTVVGLGLFGISIFYFLTTIGQDGEKGAIRIAALEPLAGFRFCALAVALFARVAGGICTKVADVGADLVGKVEMDIPENDPRNPAVIADNVDDNVGDVAGIAADLFELFVESIIAAATLANENVVMISLPFWIAGADIVASVIGFFFVRYDDGANQKHLLFALHKGTLMASFIVIGISAAI